MPPPARILSSAALRLAVEKMRDASIDAAAIIDDFLMDVSSTRIGI